MSADGQAFARTNERSLSPPQALKRGHRAAGMLVSVMVADSRVSGVRGMVPQPSGRCLAVIGGVTKRVIGSSATGTRSPKNCRHILRSASSSVIILVVQHARYMPGGAVERGG